MNPRRLAGSGGFAGFGIGQVWAGILVGMQCPDAPALVALFVFGIGMAAYGLLGLRSQFRNPPSA